MMDDQGNRQGSQSTEAVGFTLELHLKLSYGRGRLTNHFSNLAVVLKQTGLMRLLEKAPIALPVEALGF